MIEVTFVSSNPGKLREVRSVLAPYGIRVRWLRRSLPEPQAEGLREVAVAKLAAVTPRRGYTLVEDSGLFVESLGGFPGVYSAHILKLWGLGPILELLRRRPRKAAYRAVAGLAFGSQARYFLGSVRGTIARTARGSNGFGYDPIFVPAGFARTFGELPASTKDALSHRAVALRKVARFLVRHEGARARSSRRRKGRKGFV